MTTATKSKDITSARFVTKRRRVGERIYRPGDYYPLDDPKTVDKMDRAGLVAGLDDSWIRRVRSSRGLPLDSLSRDEKEGRHGDPVERADDEIRDRELYIISEKEAARLYRLVADQRAAEYEKRIAEESRSMAPSQRERTIATNGAIAEKLGAEVEKAEKLIAKVLEVDKVLRSGGKSDQYEAVLKLAETERRSRALRDEVESLSLGPDSRGAINDLVDRLDARAAEVRDELGIG